MFIHFETKCHWNIIISTTRHNLVEDTAGPGAGLCTCQKSTFANQVDNDKDSPVPWYSKSPTGEDWSAGNCAPSFKCRNFFRKIHRLSRRIHRMYPQRHADATHDEPPPPYEYHRHMQELPALSIHELPDQCIPAELESPMEQTNEDPLDVGPSRTSYPCSSESNERCASANRIVLQQTPSFEAPRPPWSLDTQQHFGAAPSMTSGGQSRKSSPKLPVTPDVNGDYPTQLHLNTDLMPDLVSPLDSISPYNHFWAIQDLVDTECDYASHISLPTSLGAIPMESVRETVQHSQAQPLDIQPNDCTRFAVPLQFASQGSCIPGNHPAFARDDSLLESYAQCYDTTRVRLGIYEYGDHREWRYRGMCGQDATENEDAGYTELTANLPGSSQYTPHFDESQQPSHKYIELYDHQAPEVDIGSRADEIDHPLERCGQCDKTFSGRYRKSNLRRHFRTFHNSLSAVVRTACRVCKRVYRRADATRKHEWKKHHIPDAKPKKRAK